jgi:hypothetical protein
VSKKYDTLSFLIGADALNVQDQEDCAPELKAWVAGTLATIFSDPDTLRIEDGDVTARITTSDTSGSLLRDRYVSPSNSCRVLRLITVFQYHIQHRTADEVWGSREDGLHDSFPF